MQNFVARPFTSTTPEEQTLGIVLSWMADNLMGDSVQPILQKHHLDHFDITHWYPTQRIQDVARDICKEPDTMNIFVAIGKKFAAELPFASDVKTLPDALLAFNAAYSQLNQAAHPDEGLLVEPAADGTFTIINNTPWPGELVFGMLSSLASRFQAGPHTRVLLGAPDMHLRSVFEIIC